MVKAVILKLSPGDLLYSALIPLLKQWYQRSSFTFFFFFFRY
uniref:Uncharacterized protein n=1 Tax=Anguilla anguilla TaxID=7936 RepID=A0A0E9V9K5_ANGAN